MVPTIIFKTPTQDQIQHLINEWEKSKKENPYIDTVLKDDYFLHNAFYKILEIKNDGVAYGVDTFIQSVEDYKQKNERSYETRFNFTPKVRSFWDFLRSENTHGTIMISNEYYDCNVKKYFLGDELYAMSVYSPQTEEVLP